MCAALVAVLQAACSSADRSVADPPPSAEAPAPTAPAAGAGSAAPQVRVLAVPTGPVRNWTELRERAARRMVSANPDGTYLGTPPEVLLAIPVLQIELNADGSVRRIEVLRHPRQARDTTQLAIDAVRRAAPFGNVSHLPKPWKFTETFLFDDQRRFKPRTLD